VNRRTRLGFDRKIHIEWLDATASKVANGARDAQLRAYLSTLLEGDLSGTAYRGASDKTVTVLSHIWSRVPPQVEPLRARALALLATADPPQRLAIHWAMAISTYPFFEDVAAAVGRLLTLQRNVSLAPVMRRLVAQWGDRSTMVRAVQRVVRSMAQWGVLEPADSRGTYRRATARPVDGQLVELLVEALLIDSRRDSLIVSQLGNHPALFPFALRVTTHDLRASGRFTLHRQGVDGDVVELATRRLDEPDRSCP